MSSSPVSVVVPVVLVNLGSVPVSAEVVDQSSEHNAEMSTTTSRFLSPNRPGSPVSASTSLEQMVVESLTPYETPEVLLDTSPAANRLESQESHLASVQLSPNRVREDYTFDTVSTKGHGYLPCVSPVSFPGSPAAPTLGFLLDEATGLYGSIIGYVAVNY